MVPRFRRDPYLVLRYNAANLLLGWATLVAAALLFPGRAFAFSPAWLLAVVVFLIPEFFVQLAGGTAILIAFGLTGGFEGRPWLALLLPAAALFAFTSGMLMHNAAHGNVGPPALNRAVGELCGFHQLGGFVVWTIVHLTHHQHADDPVYDPHPPGDKTFTAYIRTAFMGLVTCMNRLYADTWTAKDPRLARVWTLTGTVGALARVTRLLLLLVLLRPAGFACFFAPSYVIVTFLYWHFNYATHRPAPDGSTELRDLDHNAYYRIANRIFFGFYFHKTHHKKPRFFNPAGAAASRAG